MGKEININRIAGYETRAQDLSKDSLIQLVGILLEFGKYKESVNILYQGLVRNETDPDIELKYIGLILCHIKKKEEWLDNTEIKPGTTVLVEFEDGKSGWHYLPDDSSDLSILKSIALKPSEKTYQILLGKKSGEEVVWRNDPVFPIIGKIKGIKSKFIFVLHNLMDSFEKSHTDHKGMMSVNFFKPDGTLDIDKFVTINRKLNEPQNKAIAEYKNNKLPLYALARLTGKNPAEAFYNIINDLSIEVKCSTGNSHEIEQAISTLSNSKGIVLDFTAIISIHKLGCIEEVQKSLPQFYVTQSTIDVFTNFIAQQKPLIDKGYGHMGEKDGKPYFVQFTANEVKEFTQYLNKIVDWMRKDCKLIIPEEKLDLDRKVISYLSDVLGCASVDTMIASKSEQFSILTDDLFTRLTAQEEFSIKGAWTQIALIHALNNNFLTKEQYLNSVSQLATWRYNYTTINNHLLWFVFDKYRTVSDIRFLIPLQILGNTTSDSQPAVNVACNFIQQVLESNFPLMIKRTTLGTVLKILKAAPDGEQRVRKVCFTLRTRFENPKIVSDAISDWRNGYIPVPDVDRLLSFLKE
jgi:hypothetical protein